MHIHPLSRPEFGWRAIGLVATLGTLLALTVSLAQAGAPLGTAFTYQGQLKKNGALVSGTCDFQFKLFDAASAGTQVGSAVSANAVPVMNGLFTVQLDFGAGAFSGDARWLEVAVKCAGDSAFTTLTPRQALTATPYALHARNNWALNGNAGTTAGTNFVGTTDNQPLELKVNNQRALRLEPDTTSSANKPNVIGGSAGNTVTSGKVAATIGGGGDPSDSGCGGPCVNKVTASYGTVGGGSGNEVNGQSGFVGGGYKNKASNFNATVAGGFGNTASGDKSTVGGGQGNTAGFLFATVGGGYNNVAGNNTATVGGGGSNTASGPTSTVCGGGSNTASGLNATVCGGEGNTASGTTSFAAGYRAQAVNDGTFVFADVSSNSYFPSTAVNQFRVRATGGVQFVTGIDGSGNPTAGVQVASGGGSWSSLSDRAAKANLAPVDRRVILEQVARLPIQTWNYTAQDPSIRHIGPMAQDFYAAFGVGEDDRHISTIDADGVALAAIQGLYQQNQELQQENAALRSRLNTLEARLAALERGGAGAADAPLGALGWPGVGLALAGLGGVAWAVRGATRGNGGQQ
jgi:hypothetical protein